MQRLPYYTHVPYPAGDLVLQLYFCGYVHSSLPGSNVTLQNKRVVSVKGGCLEGLDWGKAIHIWTKSAVSKTFLK